MRVTRKLVYASTIVAMLAMTGGFVMAQVLAPPTTVTQNVNNYAGGSASTVDFPTAPTLAVSTSGNPTVASASVTGSAAGGSTLTLAFCAANGCTLAASDFDELYTFTSSATVASGAANTFTVYTTSGANSNTLVGSYSSTVLHSGSDTVEIYVDYGTAPPAAGIQTLDVVVTGN